MPSNTDEILYHFQSRITESDVFLMFAYRNSFALATAWIFCVPHVLAISQKSVLEPTIFFITGLSHLVQVHCIPITCIYHFLTSQNIVQTPESSLASLMENSIDTEILSWSFTISLVCHRLLIWNWFTGLPIYRLVPITFVSVLFEMALQY